MKRNSRTMHNGYGMEWIQLVSLVCWWCYYCFNNSIFIINSLKLHTRSTLVRFLVFLVSLKILYILQIIDLYIYTCFLTHPQNISLLHFLVMRQQSLLHNCAGFLLFLSFGNDINLCLRRAAISSQNGVQIYILYIGCASHIPYFQTLQVLDVIRSPFEY